MWHENVLGTIGNTPLVRLQRLARDIPCVVLAKLEFFSAGGSVKDRIGIEMIEEAERQGKLKPGGTIIECTSGNTGAGLAIAAIAKGYRCIFTTTDKQSREKIAVLRALGAEVIVCPTNVKPDDPKSYYSVAARLAREIPNAYHVNQYENPANPQAHYKTTGPELWEQTEGRITHLFVGAGTGGTICGTTRYLKEKKPTLKTIGVDPYGSVYYKYFHERVFDEKEIYPYLIEGVGEDILAGNMDWDLIDDFVKVGDKEAMQMTRRLAREEGLFAGGSSGMAVAGTLAWLREHRAELTGEEVAVVILPDGGFRYLNKIYDDRWMQDHGFLERESALTAQGILEREGALTELVAVPPDATVAEAVSLMTRHGISQLPVLRGADVLGSLEETGVLHRLIEEPDARGRLVQDVMGPPPAIVEPSAPVEQLAPLLERPPGAVLVRVQAPGGRAPYRILTKSDLLAALVARNGR